VSHKSRNLLALIALAVLFAYAPIASAQQPSDKILAQLKRAVVIVTTYDDSGRAQFQGSGFFITPERVVTNLHVIKHASRIRIKTFAGKLATVQTVVATDANADLALLQISEACHDITTVELEYAPPAEGESITVISNPQGSHWKVTRGQAGAIWEFKDSGKRMQITASILPGSSGGPVFNQQGHVIGIAVMHTSSGEDFNFAVPAASLKALQAAASIATNRASIERN
jgi:S1-C subfamily serine protease